MAVRLAAWNPSNANQFAQYQNRLELWNIEQEEGRKATLFCSLKAQHLSCFEWQNKGHNAMMAYGTSVGSVHLVNWEQREESVLCEDSSKITKRSCHTVAWNNIDCNRLAAGFEVSKSAESCIAVWDIEQQKAQKVPSFETCCCLDWLPANSSILVSGNSMGWIKLYDTRTNSQSANLTWLAHPANRPRKVRGIRPNPFDSNVLATFSDALGDFVKIWDLRQIPSKASTKKTGILQAFCINPFFSGHDITNASGMINDISWSPIRSGVIAVASSSQRCISFFRYDHSRPESGPHSNLTSSPLYTIGTTDQVKSLSWQTDEQVRGFLQSGLDSSNVVFPDPTIAEDGADHAAKWEAFVQLNPSVENFEIHRSQKKVSTRESTELLSSKRLLGTIGTGTYDFEVKDDAPFAFGNKWLAVSMQGGKVGIAKSSLDVIDTSAMSQLEVQDSKIDLLLRSMMDQNVVMRDRATAGYSLDAMTNCEVLAEELDVLHRVINDKLGNNTSLDLSLSSRIYEIYRVWEWLDRFEANLNESRLSVQKCGVLQVLGIEDINKFTEISEKVDTSITSSHTYTSATCYFSRSRATIKKLCGWVNTLGIDNSNNNSTSSLSASMASKPMSWGDWHSTRSESAFGDSVKEDRDNDLLEHIVENCLQYSFERGAAVALWHGNLNYAVRILQDAVESHYKGNNASANPKSSNSRVHRNSIGSVDTHDNNVNNPEDADTFSDKSKVEWDYPVSDAYIQMVSLVSMCIGGFYAEYDKGEGSRDRVAWRTGCQHVINQLKTIQRHSSSYLLACCQFLLVNYLQQDDSQKIASSMARYSNILEDPRIVLEDKISFAATFLDDEDLIEWLLHLKQKCLAEGSIEGLLLTGLSMQGCDILQRFVDRTNDIQSTCLISCRILHSSENNSASSSSFVSDDVESSRKKRATIWLHDYRTLLNKWQMHIERAHLDIEIGQRIQKNKAQRSQNGSQRTLSQKSSTNSLKGGNAGAAAASSTAANAANAAGGKFGRGSLGGNAAGVTQVTIPVYESALNKTSKLMQFSFVKLKCSFCNTLLPLDDVSSSRTDTLRSQKNIMNCCANCSKQLPKCYVCQLHMGMVNPYLQIERLASDLRNQSLQALEQSKSGKDGIVSKSAQPPTGYNANGNKTEDSLLSFGRWFLFCQRCRHGGHSSCITAWFNHHKHRNTGNATSSQDIYCLPTSSGNKADQEISTICGVNGCNCECRWRC